jgi:hypothetical protein
VFLSGFSFSSLKKNNFEETVIRKTKLHQWYNGFMFAQRMIDHVLRLDLLIPAQRMVDHVLRLSLLIPAQRMVDRVLRLSAKLTEATACGKHVASLGHIILIPSQPVFALSP